MSFHFAQYLTDADKTLLTSLTREDVSREIVDRAQHLMGDLRRRCVEVQPPIPDKYTFRLGDDFELLVFYDGVQRAEGGYLLDA